MKKFVIICCFFLITAIFGFSGPESLPPLDWQRIQTVKGGMRECQFSAAGYMGELTGKATYDEKGLLVLLEQDFATIKFIYNKNGKLTEYQSGFLSEENGKFEVYSRCVYTYDNTGNLVKIENFDDSDTIFSTMKVIGQDNTGNIKLETLDEQGRVASSDLLTKDLLPLENIFYDYIDEKTPNKSKMDSKTNYTYDKDGNLIQIILENIGAEAPTPAKIIWKIQYKFDKSGNKVSASCTVTPSHKDEKYSFFDPEYATVNFKYSAKLTEKQNETSPVKEEKTETTKVETKKEETKKKDTKSNLINKKVQVEWNESWYDATILKVENDKYLIHYDGYDSSWDEWVTNDRIQF